MSPGIIVTFSEREEEATNVSTVNIDGVIMCRTATPPKNEKTRRMRNLVWTPSTRLLHTARAEGPSPRQAIIL